VETGVLVREVTAGTPAARAGLQPGDVVVTEGSFFLRAEAVRNAPS
jgi:C-terminal processing protease CtpA/Prc